MAEGVKEAAGDDVVGEAAGDIEPPPDPVQAPYGYTRDKKAPGGWRPKKRPGRGGRLRAAEPEPEPERPEREGLDPDPGWYDDDRPAPRPVFEATKQDKDDVAALLALLYSVPADFLMQVDPYCFGALNGQLAQIIDATVPIVCRSERMVRYITGGTGLILWVKLGIALKPVAVAAWRHHVVHSVQLLQDEDTGQIVAQEFDYSVYTAA